MTRVSNSKLNTQASVHTGPVHVINRNQAMKNYVKCVHLLRFSSVRETHFRHLSRCLSSCKGVLILNTTDFPVTRRISSFIGIGYVIVVAI